MNTLPHYVLTGGPCAGKTTTLELLKARGYGVSPEPGRIYFERQLALGHTLEELLSDMPKLEKDILREHIELERLNRKDTHVFFDRGMPDCLAYYRVYGVPEDEELWDALKNAHYKKVFLLDLIEAFENDSVRIETPEQAKNIHDAIKSAYEELGHEIVQVPVLPPNERVEFILERL